jgi:glycosyltransferase involved in cell wall biosynthesis
MKIVFATVFDYPHAGGLSTHVQTLVGALTALGHEVSVATPRRRSSLRLDLLGRAPSRLLQLLGQDQGIVWSHRVRLSLLEAVIAAVPADARIVAEDVLAALAAAASHRPALLTVHGYFTREALSRRGLRAGSYGERVFSRWEEQGYRAAARIVAVDTRIREHIAAVAGRSDVRVQKNFIDMAWAEALPTRAEARQVLGLGEAPVVLCPRRLTPKNGVHVAVSAMAAWPEAHLLIVGDGVDRERLEAQVRSRGLAERVTFTGAQPHTAMALYYAAADCIAVPSVPVAGVEEATSISVLEGMASGRPVVASAIGGLRELIESGRNGLLVPPDDPGALAAALQEAIGRRAEFGSAAQDEVRRHYSARAAAQAFLSDLAELG